MKFILPGVILVRAAGWKMTAIQAVIQPYTVCHVWLQQMAALQGNTALANSVKAVISDLGGDNI